MSFHALLINSILSILLENVKCTGTCTSLTLLLLMGVSHCAGGGTHLLPPMIVKAVADARNNSNALNVKMHIDRYALSK